MKKFIVIIILIASFNTFSQNSKGFYGRKFFFTSESVVSSPLFYNLSTLNDKYKYNKSLNYSNDWFNYGFRFSFGHVIKKNFAISIEYGRDDSHAYLTTQNNYFGGLHNFKVPRAEIITNDFKIKFEIFSKSSIAPLGLSHQIGIGLSNSKMIDNSYNVKVSLYPVVYKSYGAYYDENLYISLDKSYLKEHFYNWENPVPCKTLNIMYGIIMRTAIAKKIMFNYGFRYNLNIGISKKKNNSESNYIFKSNTVRSDIYNQQFLNLINLNLGFTYIL